MSIYICAFILCAMLIIMACSNEQSYYVVGNGNQREYLRWLLADIYRNDITPSEEITLAELIAAQLVDSRHPERAHQFLVGLTQRDSAHPNNGYLLYVVGEILREGGQPERALHYYQQVVSLYPDTIVYGQSIHYLSLLRLVEHSVDRERSILYHRMLINSFAHLIDPFTHYQRINSYYEQLAQWENLYTAYHELLNYCNTTGSACSTTNERIDYMDTVRAALRFHDTDKQWVSPDINLLVRNIKRALIANNPQSLLQWKAGANFSSRSAPQEEFDYNSQINFNVGIFLTRSHVQFSAELDVASNSEEAYLRTWGWSHRIPIWYFYFRRVDYPLDPEIDGNWEWAGILFGELY